MTNKEMITLLEDRKQQIELMLEEEDDREYKLMLKGRLDEVTDILQAVERAEAVVTL